MSSDNGIIGLIFAISKKQALKYGNIGITNILPDYTDNTINFMLENGTSVKYNMNVFNYMKIADYDKNSNGVIDLCEVANSAKEAEKSKDSDKLGNKLPSAYFQKSIDNTDNITEGNINKFITQGDKDKLSTIPDNLNTELSNKMSKSIYDVDNDGIVDKCKALVGMTITVEDLNKLQGVTSNVQSQINNLSKALTIKNVLNTYAELQGVNSKNSGDAYVIKVDESVQGNNARTWYTWNGTEWLFLGIMTPELRNFLTNPIKLDTETTGILSQSKMDLTGIAKTTDLHNHSNKTLLDSYTESNVDLKDSVSKKHNHTNKDTLDKLTTSIEGKLLYNGNLIEGTGGSGSVDLTNYYNKTEIDNKIGKETLTTLSKTVIGAINEVKQESFQNGVNAKQKVVTALTSKGAKVTTDNTFSELSNAILSLTIPPSTLQVTKLNCTLGEKKIVNYGRDLSDLKFATSVLKFKEGQQNVTTKICSYNNTDSTNFIYDINKTVFDGKMKPKNDFIVNATSSQDLDATYTETVYHIQKDNYKSIGEIVSNDNNTLAIQAIMSPYIIYGKGNIDIKNINKLRKINLNMQGYRVLLSFDSDTTWKSYYNGQWIDVDVNNLEDVKLKSMNKTILDTLTDTQLEVVRDGSNTIKFAYYQEQNSISDILYTDELDLVVDIMGSDIIANQSDWSYRIYDDGMSIEYTFNVAGTFTINRI